MRDEVVLYGRGFVFLLCFIFEGCFVWSEGEVNVCEFICILLFMVQGECLCWLDYGVGLECFLFEFNVLMIWCVIEEFICCQFVRWELCVQVEVIYVVVDLNDFEVVFVEFSFILVVIVQVGWISFFVFVQGR